MTIEKLGEGFGVRPEPKGHPPVGTSQRPRGRPERGAGSPCGPGELDVVGGPAGEAA